MIENNEISTLINTLKTRKSLNMIKGKPRYLTCLKCIATFPVLNCLNQIDKNDAEKLFREIHQEHYIGILTEEEIITFAEERSNEKTKLNKLYKKIFNDKLESKKIF